MYSKIHWFVNDDKSEQILLFKLTDVEIEFFIICCRWLDIMICLYLLIIRLTCKNTRINENNALMDPGLAVKFLLGCSEIQTVLLCHTSVLHYGSTNCSRSFVCLFFWCGLVVTILRGWKTATISLPTLPMGSKFVKWLELLVIDC